MSEFISMQHLAPGETAVVKRLYTTGSMRRRLMDLGLVENTAVECLGRSPCGTPSAFLIRGAVIAIRPEDCAGILLSV